MAQLKSFFDLMNELSMKKDKNLPNLKVPVKGKKGVSKYMRKAGITSKKPYDSEFRQRMVASVQSADRKPELYTKPDGKKGVRMVATDREVVKTEAYTMGKPVEKKKKDVGEKTYMRTDSKLKNLKVPVTRKKGKITIPGSKLATSRKEALDSKDKPFVKDLVKKLRGGSKTHAKQADDLEKAMKEETNFAVSIEGLPTMFMSADSPGMLKQTLRKIVKQPSMIQSVKRVTDAKVKKTFRLKAQGKEEEDE